MSRKNEKFRNPIRLLLENKEDDGTLSAAFEKLVGPLKKLKKKRAKPGAATGGRGSGSVKRGRSTSYLQDDTKSMDRSRRLMEQDGHRKIAKVHARNHEDEDKAVSTPEGELQNTIAQHPLLDKQCFDGIDPSLNPEPPLNTDARREYDNAKRDQEMEKQLRLGLMPKFQTAPKPKLIMSIASDIISGRMPEFDLLVRSGESLDDVDEYGFTPLIECAIARQPQIAEQLLKRKVVVNKADVTGRTPLHWAVDNEDLDMTRLLLEHGANANAYTTAGLSILVYPLLRGQNQLKTMLYQFGAKLDFALDFIHGKLLGHRYELKGDVDIVNAEGEFIELDFEGFILEFTVAVLKDSLRRFTSSYSTRSMRQFFPLLHQIMDALGLASRLLQLQHHTEITTADQAEIGQALLAPLLILPAASRGHALSFVRFHQFWAKIDRGENSLKEGSVNIYQITRPEQLTVHFLRDFLYKKQARRYFHETINKQLGLQPIAQIPLSSQISGNCSWANVQAVVPVAYALQKLAATQDLAVDEALHVYDSWVEWDKDRALDECVHRFYLADNIRKASLASMLGVVLFQACDYDNPHHVVRAEKILSVLTIPEYHYILKSYLETYCVKRLTRKGNNLLKLLDDCGVNPQINVTPIATGLGEGE